MLVVPVSFGTMALLGLIGFSILGFAIVGSLVGDSFRKLIKAPGRSPFERIRPLLIGGIVVIMAINVVAQNLA